jgi:hypothetical protein
VTVTISVLAASTDSLFSREGLLVLLGGAAAIMASLGLLLLLPLYLTQRREVERLVDWMDRDPDAGTTEFRAVHWREPAARSTGAMTPAQRVTSERPALARISTAERDALVLEQQPLWRRVIERGPRHPLVLTILALLVAVAIVAAAGILIHSGDGETAKKGGGVNPATVQVVVVNASDSSGVAGDVSSELTRKGFDVTGTTVGTGSVTKSVVQYAPDQKAEGRAVARSLGLQAHEFDPEAEAAADGADVVVLAGEDMKASNGDKG